MTTTVTSVISTTGSDHGTGLTVYTTLQAWEDAMPADLTAVDQIWRGECYNDGEFLSTTAEVLIIGGTACDSARYIELTAAAGSGTNGPNYFGDSATVAADARKYDASKGVGIRTTATYRVAISVANEADLYVKISKIQAHGAGGFAHSGSGAADSIDINQCLMQARRPNAVIGINRGTVRNSWAIRETAPGSTDGAIRIKYGASAYGCTAVIATNVSNASSIGILSNNSACVVKNCAVFGFATVQSGTVDTVNSGYNATDLASGLPGSNNVYSLTYANQFEDPGVAKDFRLKAGADLIGAGIADATNSTLDGLGATRPNPPSIGAEEPAAAAGGATTLAVAAGSFILTGQAATLRHNRALAAGAGAFTLTGNDAAMRRGLSMGASPGAFILSGQNVGFKRAYALAAAVGAFDLTGIAAGFRRGLKLPAEAGAFILTGKDVVLTEGVATAPVLSAAAGTFVLSGQDAVLRAARKLVAEAGAFTLTGNNAALGRALTMLSEAGVFSLSGQAAALRVAQRLVADAGEFIITGQGVQFASSADFDFPDTEVMYAPWVQRTIVVALEDRTVYAQPSSEPFLADEDRTMIAPNRRSN